MRLAMAMITLLFILPFPFGVRAVQAAPASSEAYRIVFAHRAARAGDRVELRLSPPAPSGVRVNWSIGPGATRPELRSGVYLAPYVIPTGTPPARLNVGLSGPGFRASASAEIELEPGSVPGADACLGPGQSYSTTGAGIEPEYTRLDVLPGLIQRVEPVYPRSAFVRGVADTLAIRALVCRTGRVLDAVALPRYRDTLDPAPIDEDPKLVEAALTAVLHYVFNPGTAGGQAMAAWVNIGVVMHP